MRDAIFSRPVCDDRLCLGLLLSGFALVGGHGPDQDVMVFAAASLKNALDEVAAAWTRETGKKATISYAASYALAKQIEAGAPADLFISADLDWMDYLAAKKLIEPESRVNLLGNRSCCRAEGFQRSGRARSRASISPRSSAAAGWRWAMSMRCRPANTARRRSSMLGAWDGVKDKSRRPRTCARRSCSWRAARRRSASSTRPTPRRPNVKIVATLPGR